MMNVLIAVGGTGGHLLPAQQLANDLADVQILFAGFGLESSRFFQRDRHAFRAIASAPLRLTPRGVYAFLVAMVCGTWQALRLLRSFKPEFVIGFGSYHSFPVLLAAALLRKKIILFEANCLLGKVNQFFIPFAHRIGTQFPLQLRRECLVSLLPWKEFKIIDQHYARQTLGLELERPTILVFGGSQGALFLNRALPNVISSSVQVIHLTGSEATVQEVKERYLSAGIRAVVVAFEKEMSLVYAAADCAICRAGASTIAELIRAELPALLIPFPFAAEDHQRINAEFLAKKIGGAKMLLERQAQEEVLRVQVMELFNEADDLRNNLARFRKSCEGRINFKELLNT